MVFLDYCSSCSCGLDVCSCEYEPGADHCYQCSEALPDGEGIERGPHVFCRACNHELDADDPTLALPVERMADLINERRM